MLLLTAPTHNGPCTVRVFRIAGAVAILVAASLANSCTYGVATLEGIRETLQD